MWRELRLRHPKVLGLPARNLAVELGVAEQRGAHALVADLRRLALRVELLVAHVATAARDLERDDDPVTDRQIGHARDRPRDDAHRLVAQDVAGFMNGAEHFVEMQVGSADVGGGDFG